MNLEAYTKVERRNERNLTEDKNGCRRRRVNRTKIVKERTR